jgi:hypothetical protein
VAWLASVKQSPTIVYHLQTTMTTIVSFHVYKNKENYTENNTHIENENQKTQNSTTTKNENTIPFISRENKGGARLVSFAYTMTREGASSLPLRLGALAVLNAINEHVSLSEKKKGKMLCVMRVRSSSSIRSYPHQSR